jgi:hypothetical protein
MGLHKGNLRYLAREGSATMFIGLGNCSVTGCSPGCCQLPIGHNTLRRHIYIMGLINSPLCRRKPQLTICVSVTLNHKDACL